MTERPRALSKALVEHINRASSHRSERVLDRLAIAAQAAVDLRAKDRRAARECAFCFYLDTRIAGRSFTRWQCVVCGDEAHHSNTAVPKLCAACSDEYDLCTACMGDLEMRHRRTVRAKRKPRRQKPKQQEST